ncbi:MAG: diadenylate cyclase [Flavobacteriaceae bacterium]|nr:diadenylate cyclase [Flavobacteriaceae bacterium]
MGKFDFLELSIIDIIDVVLVAILLYYVYRLVRGTAAIKIFIGIVIIYLIWKLTDALNMDVLSNILGKFISVGVFALIVVFQQEIRKFLLLLGSPKLSNRKSVVRYLNFFKGSSMALEVDSDMLIDACNTLGQNKTGALIILERNNDLDFVKGSGDPVSLKASIPVIESIFFKNSPLHDGAIIIEGDTITATRVVLPVSDNKQIPARFGLRHRAAIGITEKTDALALVVSEETGGISYIKNGEFSYFKDHDALKKILAEDLS